MKYLALAFTTIIGLIVLFQVALILGAPLGDFTLGGQWPGVLPIKVRVVLAVSIVLLLAMARIVLGSSTVLRPWGPHWLIWLVCAYMALGIFVHVVSPSHAERIVWLPVLGILFIIVLSIAIKSSPRLHR